MSRNSRARDGLLQWNDSELLAPEEGGGRSAAQGASRTLGSPWPSRAEEAVLSPPRVLREQAAASGCKAESQWPPLSSAPHHKRAEDSPSGPHKLENRASPLAPLLTVVLPNFAHFNCTNYTLTIELLANCFLSSY